MNELEKPVAFGARKLIVLGTDHRVQGEKFQGSVDDPCYRDMIEQLIPAYKVDFLFEEASGHAPTHAELIAHSLLGPGQYLDVDPPRAERGKHGLSEDTGEGLVVDLWQSPPCAAWTEYVNKQAAREEYWLGRVRGREFVSALMICGFAHGLSFAFRLRSAGFDVEACVGYMPHHKLCGHVATATGG
jgi:hypothetical protein